MKRRSNPFTKTGQCIKFVRRTFAGHFFCSVSGEPGDDQAVLRVRGSIYKVTYIVDGISRSINDIDPPDIESVSVLKDGASAAVYGLKGAGGVLSSLLNKERTGRKVKNHI
ncbi:TonB-dependent receptor plug domain-containing protein [Bacteroides thetaiotaomicron]|nr:TonB-dependent receptor plug domain-containing protein [Bacteroides thetaiotaomicron]